MNSINKLNFSDSKLGILGGGQLGKMLVNAANNWSITSFILDPSKDCSAATVCSNFITGDFKKYEDVYSFGKLVDILTIEIEDVNTDALLQLEKEGLLVFPEPQVLEIIKDKGLQKKIYDKHNLPTSKYILLNNKEEIIAAVNEGKLKFPFVQKTRKFGYDGKGVAVIKTQEDLAGLLDGESLVEDLVAIQKEISVIIARNRKGEVAIFPPVEMIFNSAANLVEFLLSPANLSKEIEKEVIQLAIEVSNAFQLTGVLAVEMFLDKNNKIYINEVAPRPHNSGHQTIENAHTSQYEQHLRAIFGLPLGSTKLISPSVMVNLLGEEGYSGQAIYSGFEQCIQIEGANLHLYGKKETRPYRKMGHATVLDTSIENAKKKAQIIQQTLKIIS